MCDTSGTAGNTTPKTDQALLQIQRRQVLGALAGGIAHDFNNILTGIIAGLDLSLTDEGLPPKLKDRLSKMVSAARRGAVFNARLLAFNQSVETLAARTNLAGVVEDALFLLQPVFGHRFELLVSPLPMGLWPAQAKAGQLMQALLNLCLWVRDCQPSGSRIEIGLANERIAADPAALPRRAGEFVTLTVRVTGAEASAELWRWFLPSANRAPRSATPADWSLAVSQQIVEQHGGWIEAASGPGCESCVKLFLPRATASASGPYPGARAAGDDVPSATGPHGNEVILLVDEEQSDRWMLRAILAYRGYTVLEAGRCDEAIRLGEQAMGKIDLVLLKSKLPELNRPEFGEQIRRSNPQACVVAVEDGGLEQPAVRGAGDAVLSKRLSGADLLRLVRQALDASKAGRPS